MRLIKGLTIPPDFHLPEKVIVANPRFPPEAKKVIRDASGWRTDEPIPMIKTEASSNSDWMQKPDSAYLSK